MNRRNASAVAVLLVAAVVLVSGAARAAETTASTPIRVATLCPFVADALAGAPDRVLIVANVRRSAAEPVKPGVADLGTPHTPNTEVLAASGAEIVIVDRVMHAALAPKLEAQGLEVILVDTSSVDGTFTSLLAVGERVGASEAVSKAVDDARRQISAAKAERPERVLALMGTPSSFFVMTKRSWQGDLLDKLGFVNVGADATGDDRMPGFAPLADEVLAGLAPDRVLLVAHGDTQAVKQAFERRMQERGLWKDAKTGGFPPVEVLAPDRFLANPGLALPQLAQALVAAPDVSAAPPALEK